MAFRCSLAAAAVVGGAEAFFDGSASQLRHAASPTAGARPAAWGWAGVGSGSGATGMAERRGGVVVFQLPPKGYVQEGVDYGDLVAPPPDYEPDM